MLSVAKDHKASVIYFRVDRYYDYMDLAETICLVQYVPPGQKQNEKRRFTYIVPFFDIMKEEDEGKLIFPWVVSGKAAESEGDIQFAVCFYKIDDTNPDGPKLVYNLNTMPAKSRIVHGIQASNEPLMNLDHEEADDVYEW